MDKKDVKNRQQAESRDPDPEQNSDSTLTINEGDELSTSTTSDSETQDEVTKLSNELAELKDKYLRLTAEFDNFRKRTAKERLELIQTAGKEVITSLLEVLDDSERAEKQLQTNNDVDVMKEGVRLVFNKLRNILQAKGLRPMNSVGAPFNPDLHEAITEVPAPNNELKGKVLDEVEKGYYLNDKIIRHARVVVGK